MAARHAGRSTNRFRRLKANLRNQHRPCCLCGQPIDYRLTFPHPGSFTVEHRKSWADHPEFREDPGNLDSAHYSCNQRRKQLGIGDASCEW